MWSQTRFNWNHTTSIANVKKSWRLRWKFSQVFNSWNAKWPQVMWAELTKKVLPTLIWNLVPEITKLQQHPPSKTRHKNSNNTEDNITKNLTFYHKAVYFVKPTDNQNHSQPLFHAHIIIHLHISKFVFFFWYYNPLQVPSSPQMKAIFFYFYDKIFFSARHLV